MIHPGSTHKAYLYELPEQPHTIHIVAIVDNNMVVFKVSNEGIWQYFVKHVDVVIDYIYMAEGN